MDQETLAALVTRVNRSQRAFRDSYDRRGESGGVAAWQSAAAELRGTTAAFEAVVDDIEEALRTAQQDAVDRAIDFLVADPWCFRSGYAKGRLLRRLRTQTLSDLQKAKLNGVVLHYVDAGGRVELREATRLGRRIGGEGLRRELRRRLHSTDVGIARRALLAMMNLRRPRLSAEDRQAAHRLILAELTQHPHTIDRPGKWSWSRWPMELAPRLMDSIWLAELHAELHRYGPNRDAALQLLAQQRELHLVQRDRELIHRMLIDAIRAGTHHPWMRLVVHIDSPELRAELATLEDQGNYLANWAIVDLRDADDRRRSGPGP